MKKKLFGVVLCMLMITGVTGSVSGIVVLENTTYRTTSQENSGLMYLEQMFNPLRHNKTVVGTYGPIAPVLNFSYIQLTGGDSSQIQKIQNILQNRILQFILLREVDVTGLNFSIEYPRELPSYPLFEHFMFGTIYVADEGNFSIQNMPHQVIVTGFDGSFVLIRGKPLQFFPPTFIFIGNCSSVMVVTNKM